MVFIVIIVLSLIATYLLYSSGFLDSLKLVFKKPLDKSIYEGQSLLPGMLGSYPSDSIDVYDSKKIVVIPMDGAVNTLIESFKSNANAVYNEFKNNRNSVKYKEYIFDDYKLELLRRNDSLSTDQLNKYLSIRNTIVKDINNIFNYYLDKVKFDEERSYFTIKKEILNKEGTSLLINVSKIDSITNYALSNTSIPGNIIVLIKYKLDPNSQNIIDNIAMLAGYNYTTVLEILEQVLIREPLQSLTLLGVSNTPKVYTNSDVKSTVPGFWTQVYYAFKSNNMDNFLIDLIRSSFMTEHLYQTVLSTIIATLKNNKIMDAMNNILNLCKQSDSKIIRSFPFYYTHALLMDAIDENRLLLRNKQMIDAPSISGDLVGMTNIEYYYNLEINFPVTLQKLDVINGSSSVINIDYIDPIYPILSEDYMINDYLSFPNIKHCGVYYNITNEILDERTGYILIINTSAIKELILSGLTIYGSIQTGTSVDYQDISNTLIDKNIFLNNTLIKLEAGTYTNNTYASNPNDNGLVNSNWLNSNQIRIPASACIKIKVVKTAISTLYKYLRIYGVLIPFNTKPVSDFLTIRVIQDRITMQSSRESIFSFKNIPKNMPNILCAFDAPIYSDASLAVAGGISPANADTFTIVPRALIADGSNINLFKFTIVSSNLTTSYSSKIRTALFTSNSNGYSLASSIPADFNISNALYADRIRDPDAYAGKTITIKFTNTHASNVYTLYSVMLLGDISSTLPQNKASGAVDYVADDNVIYRPYIKCNIENTTTAVSTDAINTVIDPNNLNISSNPNIDPSSSLVIKPTYSTIDPTSVNYLTMKALYLKIGSLTVPSTFSISITTKTNNTEKILTYTNTATTQLQAADSNNLNTYQLLLLFDIPTPSSASFTILPKYTKDSFSILPNYDRFQDDPYNQYYNPISELVQYPLHY